MRADAVDPQPSGTSPPLILIVDDSPTQREIVSASLRATDYRVEQAVDGLEGFEKATAAPPDLILLDIMMPNMDGFEVCRRLRAHPATQFVPILMVTALTDLEAIAYSFKVGATDFMTKPISPTLLPYRVQYMLKTGRIEAALRSAQEEAVAAYQQVSDLSRALEERISAQHVDLEAARASLVETERQLRQSQKMEALGLLAGGIAHEFNNQLTVIGGFARAAVAGDYERVQECLAEIIAASDRAAALTGQMLMFSRTQVVTTQTVDVVEVLEGLRSVLRTSVGAEVAVWIEAETDTANVDLDPDQLSQALLNLAVNARDAMAGGGCLTVTLQVVSLGTGDRLSHYGEEIKPGRYVRIRVRDTGCGMDQETVERVFDPFFTTKEVGKGTGLGLSVIFGFVKQAGGMIHIESWPGIGTEFSLFFPLAEEGVTPSADEVPDSIPGCGETILVADDEGAVLGLVKITLEDLGYHVLAADDGADAIEVIEQQHDRIDLLITDLVMPHVGGIELAGRFAAACPEKGIIYMSGYAPSLNDHLKGVDHSFSFLKKPFQPAELARAVRDVLDS